MFLGVGSYRLSFMVYNIYLSLNLWKCRLQGKVIYLICQNILGRWKEKGRINQKR
jgi:hypothetical protein